MRSQFKIVPCAADDCDRIFATRLRATIQYCPPCRARRVQASRKRFEERRRVQEFDLVHNPGLKLNRKLHRAEFSILHDAGPQEEAFRPGAGLTRYEVFFLLKFEYIAVNSTLINNKTKCCHQVMRDNKGRLVLEPPYVFAVEGL